MTSRPTFLFCIDAGTSIGLGHLMRSWALAQVLKAHAAEIHFLCFPLSAKVEAWFQQEDISVHYLPTDEKQPHAWEAEDALGLAEQIDPQWIITDGYVFDTSFHQLLKSGGYSVLAIDDIADCHYVTDAVLNQNPGFAPQDYSAHPETRLFLGPSYALLRHGFEGQPGSRKFQGPASNIVLSTGGEDPLGLISKILQTLTLLPVPPLFVKVIWGPLNSTRPETHIRGKHRVEFMAVGPEEMPALMSWADLGISAGGSMLWEYAALKVPVVAYITANNQQRGVDYLHQQGAVRSLGPAAAFSAPPLQALLTELITNPSQRQGLSEKLWASIQPRKVADIVQYLASTKGEI